MNKSVYTENELYSMAPQRTYSNDAREAAFLLGGIGTGNISLGARGELRDWEIFNRPGKGKQTGTHARQDITRTDTNRSAAEGLNHDGFPTVNRSKGHSARKAGARTQANCNSGF